MLTVPFQNPANNRYAQLFCLVMAALLCAACDNAVEKGLEAAANIAIDVEIDVESVAVAEEFAKTFSLAIPESHKGAINLEVSSFGRGVNFFSLIPVAAQANEIFEGGKALKYNPGPHTMVAASVTKARTADEQLGRNMLRSLRDDGGVKKVFLEADGRKIAAYEESVTSYGQENLTYQILLDGGKNLVIIGPKSTFDHAFKTRLVRALIKGHPANERLYSHVSPPELDPNAVCGLGELPKDFEVQLVQVKHGAQELKNQALDPEEVAAYLQPVALGATEKPVVLVLMSGEATVWEVSRTPKSQLAGVLATGRHAQRVIGLSKDVPILETGWQRNGACRAFYSEQRNLEKNQYPDQIWETFAQDPSDVHLNQGAAGFKIGEMDAAATVSKNSLTLDEVLIDPKEHLLPGTLGIAQLLDNGALSRASMDDFDGWLQGSAVAGDEKKASRARSRVSMEVQRDRLYRINESTELPPGMGGANSMQFVAAVGIDTIPGDISHNTIYFSDGRCKGPACPR